MTEAPIYLSTADLQSIELSATELCDAIDRLYSARVPGRILSKPKISLAAAPGHQFHAMCCAVRDPAYAVCKWVTIANENRNAGRPTIHTQLVLSAFETGEPLAIISAGHLTAVKTAATSMAAARRMANSSSRSIGFIGSGVQAQAHLNLVTELFPSVTEVLVLSGPRGSTGLLERAGALGLRGRLVAEPRGILEEADLIVTTVPQQPGLHGFLDAGLVKRGAFVAAVDLGRSWIDTSLSSFDRLYTDEIEQAEFLQTSGSISSRISFDGDLFDIVSDRVSRPGNEASTDCFLFPGSALSDLAVAVLYYERAKRRGIGIRFNP